jgi:hypothetical protein
MKNYLVFHKKNGLRGFTSCKKMIKAFRLQRDMDGYDIYRVHEDDYEHYGITELYDDDEMSMLYGIVVFRDEAEVFSQSMDQYVHDFNRYMEMVLYYSSFLKLDRHEEDVISRFGNIAFELIEFLRSDEEDPEDIYDKIFDIPKMLDAIT